MTRHLLLIAASLAVASVSQAQTKLLMHYMPWYQTEPFSGYWGIHWAGPNDEFNPNIIAPDGRPEIYSHYDPLIGPYDSSDPHVLEYHLLLMKLAGVDGVIVDWYGLSNTFDYPPIHAATEVLFDVAGDLGMEFSICYEDRSIEAQVNTGALNPADIGSYFIGEFLWMQANWFNAPNYTKKDGRPLLLNFGPIYVTSPGPWNTGFGLLNPVPYFYALHNLWTQPQADGGFTWVHWSAWDNSPSEAVTKFRLNQIHNGVSADPDKVIPSAVAGFKDIYEPGGRFPFLDHQNGETLRQSLEVAIDGPWDIVQLVTWNDFGEGTMIEPTFEFGYTFLEVIQQERRDELGGAFTFTADDLRLPKRLYDLRNDTGAPQATLDTVSDLLRDGEPAQARALLDLIDGALVLPKPGDLIVDAGGTLTFTAALPVSAAGLDLQWLRDGEPVLDDARISGATTQTLTITDARYADAGAYTLRVAVAGNEVESPAGLGGVRPSALGPVDVDGDGAATGADRLEFILQVEAATGG
ncbi:MAG: hypothetical protein AAFO89_01275 [Planctomycetota bacterium]